MIIVGLMDGLGNRLFQCVLGLYLAMDHGCQLILSASALNLEPLWQLHLT